MMAEQNDLELPDQYQKQEAGITEQRTSNQAVLEEGVTEESVEATRRQREVLREAMHLVEQLGSLHKAETKKLVSCFLTLDQQHRIYFRLLLSAQSKKVWQSASSSEVFHKMFERMLNWSDDSESTRSGEVGLSIESHFDGGLLEHNDTLIDFFQRCTRYGAIKEDLVVLALRNPKSREEIVRKIMALPNGVQEIVMEAFAGTALLPLFIYGADNYVVPTTRE